MKKHILKTVFLFLILSAGLVACKNSPSQNEKKLQEAQQNLIDAQQNLKQSIDDSINDYKNYKESADLKLIENERKIAELKKDLASKKQDIKLQYENEINDLEQKNIELRNNIDGYENNDKNEWETFKINFNKELDKLGKSISDLTNKK